MCDCLKKAAENLEAHLKKSIKIENVYSFEHIGFDNQFIMLTQNKRSSGLGLSIGLPFSISYYPKRRNETRSKAVKNLRTNLFMTYCPICGKKLASPKK